MVPGKNAQTTAVDRDGPMQTKFRREVGDGGGFQIAVLCFKPTVFVLKVLVEYLEGGRVQPHIRGILGEVHEPVWPDFGQLFDGVVMGQFPEGRIDVFKQPTGLRSPTPPKVMCQFHETGETGWNAIR